MKIPIYQIDAFADKLFTGNPAAVCPLKEWLEDELLQNIAAENNLSETAFFVRENEIYHIRWFTPTTEVKLCGHATLASAFVILNILNKGTNEVIFKSLSGKLTVRKEDDKLTLDFPSQEPTLDKCFPIYDELFNSKPLEHLVSEDHLFIFENEETIKDLTINLELAKELDLRGIIVTSRGENCDFVSRFFAPKYGIDEDPATGSAYTQLIPYWSRKLFKQNLISYQLSKRGANFECSLKNDRILISGKCKLYLEGVIVV